VLLFGGSGFFTRPGPQFTNCANFSHGGCSL
jgi:hypothetical protein